MTTMRLSQKRICALSKINGVDWMMDATTDNQKSQVSQISEICLYLSESRAFLAIFSGDTRLGLK